MKPVEDPFAHPVEVVLGGHGDDFGRAAKSLLGDKLNEQSILFVSVPTAQPAGVIDAIPTPGCASCGATCWASPSSYETLNRAGLVVLCIPCLVPALRRARNERTMQ